MNVSEVIGKIEQRFKEFENDGEDLEIKTQTALQIIYEELEGKR